MTGLTIDDFERLPDDLAHNHELVEGELVDVSGNTVEHNALRDLIIALLLPFGNQHNLGRVLGEQEYQFGRNAHGPDVSFVSAATEAHFRLIEKRNRFRLEREVVSGFEPGGRTSAH